MGLFGNKKKIDGLTKRIECLEDRTREKTREIRNICEELCPHKKLDKKFEYYNMKHYIYFECELCGKTFSKKEKPKNSKVKTVIYK